MSETDLYGHTIQSYNLGELIENIIITWSQGSPFGARINYNSLKMEIYALEAIDHEKDPTVIFNVSLINGAPSPCERSNNYTINVSVEDVDDTCPYLNLTNSPLYTIYENDATALRFTVEDVDTSQLELLSVNLKSTNSTHNLTVNKTGLFPGKDH